MKITKRTILVFLACAWTIFSTTYIVYDRWNHFKTEQLNQAYNLGKANTVKQVISEAENKECKPLSIYNEKEKIQLINIDCLKQAKESK